MTREGGPMEQGRLRNHLDLEVWQCSMDLAADIYAITTRFPREEAYGISMQMRRSAVSIPSNIAEGAARRSRKEFVQFLHVALGSTAELETQVLLTRRLGFLSGGEPMTN